MNNLKHISKFLSLVLRHKPEEIGLTLDDNGWTDVDELIAKCRKGKPIILKIHALKMHGDGHPFYLSKNGVWLCDDVPAKYIEF